VKPNESQEVAEQLIDIDSGDLCTDGNKRQAEHVQHGRVFAEHLQLTPTQYRASPCACSDRTYIEMKLSFTSRKIKNIRATQLPILFHPAGINDKNTIIDRNGGLGCKKKQKKKNTFER
jgi:hypothetical protein